MTIDEMLIEIPKLTTREQLLLLEALSRALRTNLETHALPGSAEQLLGIITPGSDLSDDDLDRIRFDHVMEKHA